MANQLLPVFLKTDILNYLIVGAGNAGEEKLRNLFRHVDGAAVRLVTKEVGNECEDIIQANKGSIQVIKSAFDPKHLEGIDVVIAATNDRSANTYIREEAKKKGLLVNVVDTPDLCDFYLSSVVRIGELKIAISTNGKSPTVAKRIRELLEDVLPDELDELIANLGAYRAQLKGDLDYKIKKLNEITSEFK